MLETKPRAFCMPSKCSAIPLILTPLSRWGDSILIDLETGFELFLFPWLTTGVSFMHCCLLCLACQLHTGGCSRDARLSLTMHTWKRGPSKLAGSLHVELPKRASGHQAQGQEDSLQLECYLMLGRLRHLGDSPWLLSAACASLLFPDMLASLCLWPLQFTFSDLCFS